MSVGRHAAALLWALLLVPSAAAQISPGELSNAHARLEGSQHCLDCHARGESVAADKCLACHKRLAARIRAGRGLHANADHGDCRRCHIEHLGREAPLVDWGTRGREGFDHGRTGWPLPGVHARLACLKCHKAGGDARGYLGLERGCESCHPDPHVKQFVPRACEDCHGTDAWRPAPGFRHDTWALLGAHAAARCEGCHPGPLATRRYRGTARACATCHRDPHAGRLGASCDSCHSVSGWKPATSRALDHDRTRYALRGAHAKVECARCHDRSLRPAFARCADCHADTHAGQLRAACESCHSVEAFRPARYGPDQHAGTAFPLRGAHLAVSCDQCHPPQTAKALQKAGLAVRGPLARGPFFRVDGRRCVNCHADPHRGSLDRHAGDAGCAACHDEASWKTVRFDHARTRFTLEGRHAGVACARCHRETGGALRLAGTPATCEDCHVDPHRGQFAAPPRKAGCSACHTAQDWRATLFDHERDTPFVRLGAHRSLTCEACHRRSSGEPAGVLVYSAVPRTCALCHARERDPR